jgi:3-oxoacyl-[acyl-carrier protein] reductase
MTARVTFDFTGTTVLVTGATSGIGYATATLFRDAGADVVITGTKPDSASYDTDLTGMHYRQLRLDDHQSIDDFIPSVERLDILINNAGANFPGGLDESTPTGFDASVALNLTATYRLTVGMRKVLGQSTAAGGACVVNLASMSALRAVTVVPGYSAAKAGIISMTRLLAVKWAAQPIRVNAVAPGAIDTPMTAPAKEVPQIVNAEIAHIPAGRFGRVNEIAPTIAFLCTEHSSYTSGALFIVDGASHCL